MTTRSTSLKAVPFALVHKHPTEGQLSLSGASGTIRFACRWPFDLSTNEWISIENEFDHRAYREAVSRLARDGVARVQAKQAGYIQFALAADSRIHLEVTDANDQRPTHLNAMLELAPEQLVPAA